MPEKLKSVLVLRIYSELDFNSISDVLGISIRQILAEDAEIYPDPKLIIITEKPIPGELIPILLKIPSVSQVTIS